MSRPVQLEDAQSGQNHGCRYSYMESPVEDQGWPEQQAHAPTSPGPVPANSGLHSPQRPYQYQQHHIAIEQSIPAQDQPTQIYPNEKERHLQQEGIIPTYSKYPPPDQHPANFAPYAEPAQPQHYIQPIIHSPIHSPIQSPMQSSFQMPLGSPVYAQHVVQYPYQYQHQEQYHHQEQQQQQQAYSQPPSSPGPLPVKQTLEIPARSNTMVVAPDENPLQSPKLPSFPPPTARDSPQAQSTEDSNTFHQPGQIMHPVQEVYGGGWSHGMCDCSNNIWACFLGLICPCVLYGKTQYRLNRKSKQEDPTNMLGYETCNGSCTGMALLCGCQCLLTTIQRRRTRKAYGIPGDTGSDCVRSTCCCCCTLIQNEKEIVKREDNRSRVALERGATLTSPYIAPAPMTFPPPPK
ncbi:hypothetical protein N7456_003894 [Penicillium angulare]|uniref:PLAC8 n=1 Tax=Penicillium angulare TaxID=116970 RepID=A0A9W9KHW5_9EURO|nr:hypothetical protein N7456_003894 [Penicillium angulare]